MKIGSKTIRLQELQKIGMNVPKFIAIPSEKLQTIKATDINLDAKSYAVRSSALIEDSEKKSFAGQFQTKINVPQEGLEEAIKEVTSDALSKIKIEQFSVLIQEYIEPDFAGVTFTRNPSGGHEMMIEFHKGRGEEIVGGKVKPEHLEIFWNEEKIPNKLLNFTEAFENFKKIEQHFGHPQDIEWCIKDDTWYFLQTRPITTISAQEHEQNLYLDKTLSGQFLYEKTEISEIAPRPTPFTFSLLEKIYGHRGPVQNTYQKYNIIYQPKEFLKIIGNELFCDREKEIKTLLPAYTYFASMDLKPKAAGLSGLWTTLKNTSNLKKIKTENPEKLFESLQKETSYENFKSAISNFLKEYETIFEINLLAGVQKNKKEQEKKQEYKISFDKKLVGNSLEISDESPFSHYEFTHSLRELGRCYTVKKINNIRKILLEISKNWNNPKNIYFATIDEISENTIAEHTCEQRKKDYLKFSNFSLPKTITSVHIAEKQGSKGVSNGRAEGKIIDISMLEQFKKEPKILYTKILSPDLTQYFPQIVGIVSETGGTLSHLAIIAREQKIPVIVNFELSKSNIELGQKVVIDGEKGKISLL